MKKLICIAIVLISLFSLMVPAMAAGKKYSDVDMWVNCSNGKRLNVREAPNSGARRITQLECGTKVHVDYDAGTGDRLQVIAKGNTWFQVVDLQTGKTGYVAKQYVQKI